MKNIPLHYQILIALIVGTLLGFLFNPGEISLDNLSLTASRTGIRYQVIEKGCPESSGRIQIQRS